MRGLVWFKKDLRTIDHPALYHASQQCQDGLVAVYIIDIEMWKKNGVSDCQIEFILRGLKVLRDDLANLNISLVVENVAQTKDIPQLLLQIVETIQARKLFFNREHEVNESARDQAVMDVLAKQDIACESYEDQLILSHELVKTGQNNYFKVFTAFKREWLKTFSKVRPRTFPKPKKQLKQLVPLSDVPTHLPQINSGISPQLWCAGECEAYDRLRQFIEKSLFSYDKQRDFPALNATSQLSPYLAVGMISARECFLSALAANAEELETGNQGALTWMSELIWRDFYRHILIYVPWVCMNKAYDLKTENLPWQYNDKLLKAWQEGQTGFPIVDAAMRQLNEIGWMHNRLRMIVAMFLSKNLFLDWRLGERYFSEKLIDIDFASNNGGWQWSASTGTDAVPYFRIFNPMTQSQRFDLEGRFIRQYCPELKDLDNKAIHEPFAYGNSHLSYPHPIIDYKKSREHAISQFKNL